MHTVAGERARDTLPTADVADQDKRPSAWIVGEKAREHGTAEETRGARHENRRL